MGSSQRINEQFLEELKAVCPQCMTVFDHARLEEYGKDIASDKTYTFDYLACPQNEFEVADVVKICDKYNIPITTRGGGSGLVGGAIPLNRGLVLSMENLNRIISIDKVNMTAMVESGVINQTFCELVEQEGLFFPIQPGSSSLSFVGGNVATNCGSMSALKYGTIGNYVMNLQVVLANGEIIWTGANTTKNATGPNITGLIIGSEGTLGIITKVVFKLVSKPRFTASLKVDFASMEVLCKTLNDISNSGLRLVAVEIIDEKSSALSSKFIAHKFPKFPLHEKNQLLISFDSDHEEIIDAELEQCAALIAKRTENEILIAKSHAEKEHLWKVRMNIGEALKHNGKKYRDIDIAVPVSKLFEYIVHVQKVANYFAVQVFCFGHAGNGNLHTMMILEKDTDHHIQAVKEIYKKGIELGGTISGEHGIGNLQKVFMPDQYSPAYMSLMAKIKHVFDPKSIINPGKIYT